MKTKINDAFCFAAIIALTVTACDLEQGEAAEAQDLGQATRAAENPAAEPWAERGRLVAYKRVRELSRHEIHEALFDLPFADAYAGFGLDDFFDFYNEDEISEVVRARVDVYQVIYETIDPSGRPTTASGAVLIPRTMEGEGQARDLALWGLLRGTVFYDADVPSHGDMPDWGIWRGLLPAAAGYVVAMPDYLGFGASRHMAHPYLFSGPTASASIDMLRAARHLAAELEISLADEVFLSGHSQGGHATLATLREIEANHGAEFDVTAAAPASGAYALSGLVSFIFNSEAIIGPQVTSLYTIGFAEIYDRALSDYFRPPFDELVLELHDKTKDNAQIIAGLPSGTTDELYSDEFLAEFRGDGAPDFKTATVLNDVHTGWTPQAPVRLFHGTDDVEVPPAMSSLALAGLSGEGADIELELIEGAGHLQTIVPSTLKTIHWFDSLMSDEE